MKISNCHNSSGGIQGPGFALLTPAREPFDRDYILQKDMGQSVLKESSVELRLSQATSIFVHHFLDFYFPSDMRWLVAGTQKDELLGVDDQAKHTIGRKREEP